jgi:hypothetical protein
MPMRFQQALRAGAMAALVAGVAIPFSIAAFAAAPMVKTQAPAY